MSTSTATLSDKEPRITKGDLTELMRNATRGHENHAVCMGSLAQRLKWKYEKKRTLGTDDIRDLVEYAVLKANPGACDDPPPVEGTRHEESCQEFLAHWNGCFDCKRWRSDLGLLCRRWPRGWCLRDWLPGCRAALPPPWSRRGVLVVLGAAVLAALLNAGRRALPGRASPQAIPVARRR